MKVIIPTRSRTEWPQDNEAIPSPQHSPMAGCFEVKTRAVSLDSKSSPSAGTSRLEKFFSMFRSKSAPSIKQQSQSSTSRSGGQSSTSRSGGVSRSSSCAVGGTPKRKYVRVVRDENAPPPEKCDENPYTRREFSQEFLKKHYANHSQDQLVSRQCYEPNSSHTILKKSSTDPSSEKSSSFTGKHATFKDVVEVVEFGEQDKAECGLQCTQQWTLNDEPMEGSHHDIFAEANKRDGFFLIDESTVEEDELETDEPDGKPESPMEPSAPVETSGQLIRQTSASRDRGAMMNVFAPVVEMSARPVSELKQVKQVHHVVTTEMRTNQT